MMDQKQPENEEYLNYVGSMIRNTQDVHGKLNPGLSWPEQHSKKTLFTSQMDLHLRNKLVKCYTCSIALYGAETWTLHKADQKYLESFKMWCWRRIVKISWTDHV